MTLIYKDFHLFFRGIDIKVILLTGGMTFLLMLRAGELAGLLSSIMFAMIVGMQNVMSYYSDEKAKWKKYQLAMPIKDSQVVASRYITVILTLGITIPGSVILCTVSSMIYGGFDAALWAISLASAVLFPLLWSGICLPFAYWFGFNSAQILGMISIFPMLKLISYLENGMGIFAVSDSGYVYLLWAFLLTVVLFAASFTISIGGYARGRRR